MCFSYCKRQCPSMVTTAQLYSPHRTKSMRAKLQDRKPPGLGISRLASYPGRGAAHVLFVVCGKSLEHSV